MDAITKYIEIEAQQKGWGSFRITYNTLDLAVGDTPEIESSSTAIIIITDVFMENNAAALLTIEGGDNALKTLTPLSLERTYSDTVSVGFKIMQPFVTPINADSRNAKSCIKYIKVVEI